MRPDWFVCRTCLFGEWGCINITEENQFGDCGIVCTVNPVAVIKDMDSFCKEWVCKNCWEGWDTCYYPKSPDDESLTLTGTYINHSECEKVIFTKG